MLHVDRYLNVKVAIETTIGTVYQT